MSGITLYFIYSTKKLKFLRFMTWILIVTNMVMIFDGVFVLRILDKQGKMVYDENQDLYYSVIGFTVSMHDLGLLIIVWFVTFKYWETSRQFSRVIRVLQD